MEERVVHGREPASGERMLFAVNFLVEVVLLIDVIEGW
jgi:hypothetical protein